MKYEERGGRMKEERGKENRARKDHQANKRERKKRKVKVKVKTKTKTKTIGEEEPEAST